MSEKCNATTFAKLIKDINFGTLSVESAFIKLLSDLPKRAKIKETMEMLNAIRGNKLVGFSEQEASNFISKTKKWDEIMAMVEYVHGNALTEKRAAFIEKYGQHIDVFLGIGLPTTLSPMSRVRGSRPLGVGRPRSADLSRTLRSPPTRRGSRRAVEYRQVGIPQSSNSCSNCI